MTTAKTQTTRFGLMWTLAVVAMVGGVVACSGSTGGVSSSDGGVGDGGGGTDGGGGGDPPGCTTSAVELQRACVPGTAKANTPLSIKVDADGCFGCGQTLLPCDVRVQGNQITLALASKTCPQSADGQPVACPGICILPSSTCAIPALAAGTYFLQFADGIRASDAAPRKLVVAEGATATSCDLPPGEQPPTVAASDFPQTCAVDGDCAVIVEGDVCQPCKCPNAAIQKTAIASYESSLREAQALCKSTGGAACAACRAATAKCNVGKCGFITEE